MMVKKFSEVEKTAIQKEGVKGTSIRWLIGQDSGAPNFYLRLFELEIGGHSPFHAHPWEHEVYVLEGKGKLNTPDRSYPLEKDCFALVLPGEEHQFENCGAGPFKFLCIIPTNGQ